MSNKISIEEFEKLIRLDGWVISEYSGEIVTSPSINDHYTREIDFNIDEDCEYSPVEEHTFYKREAKKIAILNNIKIIYISVFYFNEDGIESLHSDHSKMTVKTIGITVVDDNGEPADYETLDILLPKSFRFYVADIMRF